MMLESYHNAVNGQRRMIGVRLRWSSIMAFTVRMASKHWLSTSLARSVHTFGIIARMVRCGTGGATGSALSAGTANAAPNHPNIALRPTCIGLCVS